MMTAKQIVRLVANRVHGDVGCSDGGCIFGHPGGMHTNGGCRCLEETDPVLLRRSLRRLAAVANTFASVGILRGEEA